ncbi:MAG TPA: glycerophosphodiester phosphodiesterase [Solirubrobacteraceae bacterium]|nr:glycerophosphodiester phosphodiesterase [Solirubrobacteraceae bacterium]
MRRVGHKGADLIAPGNTVASFEAALAADVDMIEFDVLPERADGTGELFLAHDYKDLARRRDDALTLAEGIELFASEAYAGVELDVDLKLPGYEDRVVAALREAGLVERVLISTMEEVSLRRIRAAAPDVKLGWSVPKVKRDPFRSVFTKLPAYGMLQVIRRTLPRRAARALREGRVDALMVNFHLVTPALVRAVLDAGGEIYVWTVDDARRIEALRGLGVTGCISNDPRLLAAAG